MSEETEREAERILAGIKRAFLTILLSIGILIFNLYIFGNVTDALLIGGDGLLNSYFAPVYSGLALLCALVIMKRDKQ